MTDVLERAPGLVSQVAQHLVDAIAAGQLKPGERLVETELASRLGVSRAPLREALRHLSSAGLVEHRPGKGAYVSSPTGDAMAQMGVFRGLLEGNAAALLASSSNEAGLARLGAILTQMEAAAAAGGGPQFVELHWQFHRNLCEGSENALLLESWDRVSRQIRMYLNMHMPAVDHPRVLRNNRAVLQTLRTGEPAVAEALVRSLIIRQTFNVLTRPIPAAIRPFVTLSVDEAGTIGPIAVERPAS
jgi:DNA-binding GntR family transcriptional regulator